MYVSPYHHMYIHVPPYNDMYIPPYHYMYSVCAPMSSQVHAPISSHVRIPIFETNISKFQFDPECSSV